MTPKKIENLSTKTRKKLRTLPNQNNEEYFEVRGAHRCVPRGAKMEHIAVAKDLRPVLEHVNQNTHAS